MKYNLVLKCVLFFTIPIYSATFIPEVGEGSDNSVVLPRNSSNLEYIKIDDMEFKTSSDKGRSAFRLSANKWTNGKVYYKFSHNVTSTNRSKWRTASDVWASVANITFIKRTSEHNYIYIQNDSRNSSVVGMAGGMQKLRILNWSNHRTIVHEIGHALGLTHEQSRSDRDNYVRILSENIKSTALHNFNKRSTITYGKYDFESIMHYRNNTFSKNGKNTIEPLERYSEYLSVMGRKSYLSDLDKSGMEKRYAYHVSRLTGTEAISGNVLLGEMKYYKINAQKNQILIVTLTNLGK